MANSVIITVEGMTIRTDWIHHIRAGKENGTPTCTIWFSLGPVGVHTFTGKAARIAFELLENHPAMKT